MFKRSCKEILRYTLSGGAAFGVDVGIFSLVRFALGMDIIAANISARASGALVAFLFNYYLTFTVNQRNALHVSALRYLWLWLASTTVSSAALHELASVSDSPPLEMLIKISVETAIIIMNFCACKFWAYKSC